MVSYLIKCHIFNKIKAASGNRVIRAGSNVEPQGARTLYLCTIQFQNRPSPPGQTPGHLTFLKNFGQIPRYVASLDGQMPHPLELQRGSNPPPSRHVKATVLNFFSCVKPFIQMYIFCNKQLATVWIKICVNCNFNDNRVIC